MPTYRCLSPDQRKMPTGSYTYVIAYQGDHLPSKCSKPTKAGEKQKTPPLQKGRGKTPWYHPDSAAICEQTAALVSAVTGAPGTDYLALAFRGCGTQGTFGALWLEELSADGSSSLKPAVHLLILRIAFVYSTSQQRACQQPREGVAIQPPVDMVHPSLYRFRKADRMPQHGVGIMGNER